MTAAVQNRPARRGGYTLPVILLVVLVVGVTNVVPFRDILAQNREIENSTAELEALQAENERLTRETDALRSPGEVERLARENFGMVRPGDTSYVIVEPVTRPVEAEVAPVVEPEIESGGILNAIWSYLTGRDLVDDG